jgi:hypothetical protein
VGTKINPYAAGQRLYNGGSRAPNLGAVRNKTGYNERELRKNAQQRAFAEQLKKMQKGRA